MDTADLDAQVAQQVMGWHRETAEVWRDPVGMQMYSQWHPSTSWADAGRVLEQTPMLRSWLLLQAKHGEWWICRTAFPVQGGYGIGGLVVNAPTGPEAISRAALVWAQEHADG